MPKRKIQRKKSPKKQIKRKHSRRYSRKLSKKRNKRRKKSRCMRSRRRYRKKSRRGKRKIQYGCAKQRGGSADSCVKYGCEYPQSMGQTFTGTELNTLKNDLIPQSTQQRLPIINLASIYVFKYFAEYFKLQRVTMNAVTSAGY